MKPLEQKVACFVEANGLFAGAASILLAVSGGADSTALLHVMRTLVARGVVYGVLVCAHLNHQLRGSAGDADEDFVVEQAQALDLPVVTRAADVAGCAKAERLSVETAGRQLRLAFLAEVARTHGCAWIATGHQLNDNAETVVQRLRRGTGFRGLAGIWPSRQLGDNLRLARPLLCCPRAEIVAYLRERGLTWREDHTNSDCSYTRNCVRHRLLPSLREGPGDSLIEATSDLAGAARRLHQQVSAQAKRAAARHARRADEGIVIEALGMAGLPEMVAVELIRRQLVRLGCGERDLTRRHYRGILRLARSGAKHKPVALPGGFRAKREHTHVILENPVSLGPPEVPTASVPLMVPGTSHYAGYRLEAQFVDRSEINVAQIRRDRNPFREYLDLDRIKLPLAVRERREGDRFHPLGAVGEKKVGKFLTTAKVPEITRRQVLIVADAQHIVWVCPVRISERTKITEQTRRILALTAVRGPSPRAMPLTEGDSAPSGGGA